MELYTLHTPYQTNFGPVCFIRLTPMCYGINGLFLCLPLCWHELSFLTRCTRNVMFLNSVVKLNLWLSENYIPSYVYMYICICRCIFQWYQCRCHETACLLVFMLSLRTIRWQTLCTFTRQFTCIYMYDPVATCSSIVLQHWCTCECCCFQLHVLLLEVVLRSLTSFRFVRCVAAVIVRTTSGPMRAKKTTNVNKTAAPARRQSMPLRQLWFLPKLIAATHSPCDANSLWMMTTTLKLSKPLEQLALSQRRQSKHQLHQSMCTSHQTPQPTVKMTSVVRWQNE